MVATLLRKFNDFKGKQRLSRLIFRSRITNTIDLVIKGKFDCIYKVPNLKEVIGLELFINGVFEENHIELIISKLPKNGVLLDLGANIGSISIPICKRYYDNQLIMSCSIILMVLLYTIILYLQMDIL